jgi:hypothetical protein
MLLSNQCRKNEKMGIHEFDEFPLPVPLLHDNPFASISAANLAAMEATPHVDDDGNEYEDDGEDGDDSEYEDDSEDSDGDDE